MERTLVVGRRAAGGPDTDETETGEDEAQR